MNQEHSRSKISKTNRPVALITGASSGIGLELAHVFAKNGHDLVLVARNRKALKILADDLRKIYGASSIIMAKDLAKSRAADEIYREVRRTRVQVDVLINNAGFGTGGNFVETDLQTELDMIQVNITALTHLTKLFLPEMVKRGRGRILNVASTAAFQPGPLMAVYYATKAYVLSLSDAIAAELAGTGVTVTTLCPGPTVTAFHQRAGIPNIRLVNRALVMEARQVAEIGYKGLMKGKRIVIPGFKNMLGAQAHRFAPRNTVTAMVKFLNERR